MFKYYFFFKGVLSVCTYVHTQDSSGWTPLMIASSLRDADDIVDLLLNKEADVNAKSESCLIQEPFLFHYFLSSSFSCLDPISSMMKQNLTDIPI